jgi:hypothetical protein
MYYPVSHFIVSLAVAPTGDLPLPPTVEGVEGGQPEGGRNSLGDIMASVRGPRRERGKWGKYKRIEKNKYGGVRVVCSEVESVGSSLAFL